MTAPLTMPLAGRWRTRWTARGLAALGLGGALLALGLVWRYPGVIGLGGAFATLAVLSLLSVLHRAPVTFRRSVWPLEVTRYERCTATLRIRRTSGILPMSIDAVDQVAGQDVPVLLPKLAPQQIFEVTYPIPTQRRGVLKVGPVAVRRRGAVGLAESSASLAGTVEVRVLPRVLHVRGVPSGVRRGHQGADEKVPRGGTDLVGLRDYLPGDDLRRIHWATSARSGQLMVREDADPSLAHLTVLLDDRAESYPDGDIEDAVEVAASLAVAAAERTHGVRLMTVCDQVDVAISESLNGVSAASARDVVSKLAEVEARGGARAPGPLPTSGLDIVVAVTGGLADLGPLLAEAGRATVGVVAVVDRGSPVDGAGRVVAVGPVTVLRGVDGAALLSVWNTAMVG